MGEKKRCSQAARHDKLPPQQMVPVRSRARGQARGSVLLQFPTHGGGICSDL